MVTAANRKLAAAVVLALIGFTGVAYATDNGLGDNICPQWTTLKCTKWSLGPPPKCTETACVADKASDPKRSALGNGGLTSGGNFQSRRANGLLFKK